MQLILLKYLSYGFVAFWGIQSESFWSGGFPVGLVLLLLWFTLSQARANFLFSKGFSFWLTVIGEVFIGTLLFLDFGGFFAVYLFSAVTDVILAKRRWPLYLALAGTGVLFTVAHTQMLSPPSYDGGRVSADIIIMVITVVFSFIIQQEEGRKRLAQQLYDKLRVSEENLKDAYDKLEKYSQTIEELTLHRERARISRELHDSAGHSLSTMTIQLKAIQSIIKSDPERAEKMLDGLVQFSNQALRNVRHVVHEMRPIEFERYEGIFAIEELIKNFKKLTGIDTRLILSRERYKINSDQSHQLYRIIQESLSNSLRHGRAGKISISIQFMHDAIYSQIKDDGVGTAQLHYGMGLKGIKQRVESLNGEMRIFTESGQGFELNITLPRRTAEEKRGDEQ